MLIRILIPLFLFLSISFPGTMEAAQPTSVYDAIESGKGNITEQPSNQKEQTTLTEEDTSLSLFPFLVKLVFSLVFIIALIFLLFKFWGTKTRQMQSRGPFHVLGGCVVGANRSIQAVLIGQTIYILGIGENVQLLRTIEKGEEYNLILDSFESMAETPSLLNTKRWFSKGEPAQKSWEDLLQDQLREMGSGGASNLQRWEKQTEEGPKKHE
ncbi:flagellar biosynthetic protein FliO [Ammoniphilus resinae]|uniref:Flagellar protein FliO/FliZ n=1 Tax=Ammoniphilus resinae TaxID=861532 RepID=A0ABS4GKL2_9BACL|nr:flagellar biosynthetic protein FliO [Ammoniphilus resinae]MBP1930794.1 flagellar protein FliO/FliZ [Ammoniphilus resinae]